MDGRWPRYYPFSSLPSDILPPPDPSCCATMTSTVCTTPLIHHGSSLQPRSNPLRYPLPPSIQSVPVCPLPPPPPSRTDLCRPVVLIQIGCVLTSPTAVKFPSVSACGRARKRTRNIKPRTSLRSVRSVWKLCADHPSRKDALPPPISKSVHRLQQDRMAFASHHCPSSSSSSRGLTETFI